MKKFFLIPLLTLMCSVMAFAVDVSTFADLKNELTKGTEPTITLTSDITINGSTSVLREVTIDLNGHTLTDGTNYISVGKNGNVTVKNGFIRVASKNSFFLAIGTNNTLTFKNVKKVADQDPNVGTIMYNDGTDVSRELIHVQQQGGTLTLDSDCDLNIVGIVDGTITNNGTGTIYLKPASITDNSVKDYLDNLPAGTKIAPSSIYASLYEDYAPYFYPGVKEHMFLTLTGDGDGIETYQLKSTTIKPEFKIEKVEKTYYFKNMEYAMMYSTNEYPCKLQKDWSQATLTCAGYLDLNGKTLTLTRSNGKPIVMVDNAQLTIKNSQPATGGIEITATGAENKYAFGITPSPTSVANYSVLTIEADVTINMPNWIGYFLTVVNTDNTGYGTVLNMNGTVNVSNGRGITLNGTVQAVDPNAPIFNIGGTINAQGIGIYAAGYGKWNINVGAQIIGHTGIAIKAGQLSLNGQVIANGDDGQRTDTWGNGVIGSNAALQIESNPSYAGEMEITIGNTANLSSTGWYAIYEYGSANTAVKSIAVTGGLFQGGILISQSLAAKGGFVTGGKWTKDISANIKTGENLSLLNNEDDDNPPYLYLVGVPAPAQAEDYAEITNLPNTTDPTQNNNAVLTNAASQSAAESYSSDNVGNDPDVIATKETNPVVVSENTDVVATEAAPIVEVKKVTVDNDAQLTVTEGATLMVGAGAVTLDENSSNGLTVEPGAALVVNGLVYGSTEDNFVIENEENNPGVVLFSPETEFIKEDHPKATYKFKSRSYKDGSKVVYQRFGIPTHDNNVRMAYETTPAEGAYSYIVNWDYEQDGWHTSGDVVDWRLIDRENGLTVGVGAPFTCFELISNNAKGAEYTYTFTGDLMGNADADMSFAPGFNPYANSYTAPIDIETFLSRIDAQFKAQGITPSIYLYHSPSNDNYQWVSVSLADFEFDEPEVTTIAPMQAFLMELGSGAAVNAQNLINYDANVYSPFMSNLNGGASLAPARKARNNNYIKLTIANEEGAVLDRVKMIEDNRFNGEYEMGYDVHKYMNDEVNMYAVANNENMAAVADSDVDNLNICVNVHEAGTYTLNVAHCGLDYVLYDLVNDAVITLTDGQAYNFYQEAGQTAPRFQLAKANKMPTNIENAEGENAQTIKVMKNGMLMIIKNGVKYNAFGQTIK